MTNSRFAKYLGVDSLLGDVDPDEFEANLPRLEDPPGGGRELPGVHGLDYPLEEISLEELQRLADDVDSWFEGQV